MLLHRKISLGLSECWFNCSEEQFWVPEIADPERGFKDTPFTSSIFPLVVFLLL